MNVILYAAMAYGVMAILSLAVVGIIVLVDKLFSGGQEDAT